MARRERSLARLVLLLLVAAGCGRTGLIAREAGVAPDAEATDVAVRSDGISADGMRSGDGPDPRCTGARKPNGCVCTDSSQCEGGFCAADVYALNEECYQTKSGKCRNTPMRDCACRVGRGPECYD
jgi:hypothetical protein